MDSRNNVDIDEAMRRLDERLRSRTPKPRGRRQALAPYADQLRKYVEAGWSRKEIVAEMRALGLSVSAATLRDVLGMVPKRRPKSLQSPVPAKLAEVPSADAAGRRFTESDTGW